MLDSNFLLFLFKVKIIGTVCKTLPGGYISTPFGQNIFKIILKNKIFQADAKLSSGCEFVYSSYDTL